MKKTKKSILKRFISAGITMVISAGVFATPAYAANELINEPYEYPIVQGTEEWAALMSFPEKIEACKIPEGKIEAMSTEALIETILNHPLWPIYIAYEKDDVYDIYRDKIINALPELESREDADELLLKVYQQDRVGRISAYNATDKNASKSEFLEVLLAEPVFYDDLSNSELVTLDVVAAEKAEVREKSPEIYPTASVFYSVLQAKQQATTRASTYVYTPRGTAVSVVRNNYPYSSTDDNYYYSLYRPTFPSIVQKSGYTTNANYNCHSYAWYSTSKTNPYWMDDPRPYMNDGSYRVVYPANGTVPATGLRVFFNSGTSKRTWHSVIVVGSYGNPSSGQNYNLCKVESKWGEAPVYIHRLLDHPWTVNFSGVDCRNYDMTFYQRS